MTKNSLPFFATENDLSKLLTNVVRVRPLQFVVCGLSDTSIVQSMPSLLKSSPRTNYLIADRDLVIEVRVVPQKGGGQKYAVDQQSNPKTIVFCPGGMIEDRCLLAGQIGTISNTQTSLEFFKLFSSEMSKQFSKIKSYYVGEEATRLLDNGVRLTGNPKSPVLYDLTRK